MYTDMISLDRNESYWMFDEELAGIMLRASENTFSTYPDYSMLKKAIAKYTGVGEEQIAITPGSDAAIEYIAKIYVSNSEEVVLPVPTFYGYEMTLQKIGAKVTPVAYEEKESGFVFPLVKTIELLKNDDEKVLFVCHPNNPLGCSLSEEDVSELVGAVTKSKNMLIVDEAYFEFSFGKSFFPYLANLPNLIIIRTFSKTFGLAGARLGYAIASPDIIANIEKNMRPWEVSHPGVSVALALLENEDKIIARRKIMVKARERFIRNLNLLSGVSAYPSETNFVLIRAPGKATDVKDALFKKGMRVAHGEKMSSFQTAKTILKDTLRIAIPDLSTQKLFIKTLKEAL